MKRGSVSLAGKVDPGPGVLGNDEVKGDTDSCARHLLTAARPLGGKSRLRVNGSD